MTDGYETLLPYTSWLEDAERLVIFQAIEYAARNGLPGDHHFYISFVTRAPGVVIPEFLLKKYPETMTIVLQHQYKDLKTFDDRNKGFSVGLSFQGIPCTLEIPLSAIVGFADPEAAIEFRLPMPAPAEIPQAPEGTIAFAPAKSPAQPPKPDAPKVAEIEETDRKVVSIDLFRKNKSEE